MSVPDLSHFWAGRGRNGVAMSRLITGIIPLRGEAGSSLPVPGGSTWNS